MIAKATNVGFAQRVVATLVACAVVLWSIGVYSTAQAANLTSISDTLSDSDVSVVSDHTIAFTVPAGSPGVLGGEKITVTFPAGFNMGSVAFGDIDFSINTVDQTLAGTPSGATWGAAVSGQVLTLTSGTDVVAASDVIEIKIGTNASGGANQITNPTAGSYELVVTAGAADTGRTRVAIINNVLVTAIVNTTFDFTITGLATSTPVNGDTTTGLTTATEIPFGVLTAGTPKVMAQKLNVTTNAANGYVVTVEQDSNLQSSTGADIDGFIDGAYTDTPTAWQAPGGTLGNENEYGHWGLTTTDGNLQGNGTAFTGTDEWVSASTTARAIMAHNSVTDGLVGTATAAGDDSGQTLVGYRIEITPLQEAADDYETTLTYVATPTF